MPSNTGNLLAFGEDIVGGFSGNGGGGSGGHTILDPSGTAMIQRPNMQFKGMKVSDNSTDNITEIDASPDNYTWDQWMAMTDEQREAIPSAIISGLPDANGNIEIETCKVLWQNNSYTTAFPSGNITLNSDDYDFIWIDVLWSTSNFRRYAIPLIPKGQSGMISIPQETSNGIGVMTRDIVYVNATTYQFGNATWKDMTAATQTLNDYAIPYRIYGFKFKQTVKIQAIAHDVSTSASKCMMSDGQTSVEEMIDRGSVSVTADGTKTYSQLFNALFALVNLSKVTNNSYLVFDYHNSSGTKARYILQEIANNYLVFNRTAASSSGARIESYYIASTGSSNMQATGSTRVDISTQIPTSGWSFEIFY